MNGRRQITWKPQYFARSLADSMSVAGGSVSTNRYSVGNQDIEASGSMRIICRTSLMDTFLSMPLAPDVWSSE